MSERGPLAALAALAPRHGQAWLVGGAVRDALLGRPTPDYDIAVQGDAGALAGELGRRAGGHVFRLSEAFGAWRVRAHDQRWQVDLTPLMGPTLEADLRRRDLTINAIARELTADGAGALIDPCGGVADLRERRLRSVGSASFETDPLRVLRLARLAAELGFTVEPDAASLATAAAPRLAEVAAERVFTELRLILLSDGAVPGLGLARQLGATAAVLPELDALAGVQQSDYHHLDVFHHTLATLQEVIDLERDPSAVFGRCTPELRAVLDAPLANELTRGQALRFGALLHDIAKPVTLGRSAEGRPTFFEHDVRGAELATVILSRLRASERLTAHTAALARHHLRLGFLVHERPLTRRAVYRYLNTCEPVEVDVTVLSVADRLATRGRNADRAVALHLDLARELLGPALAWHRNRPRPPLAGDDLAEALGIAPGPELGRLLAALTEAAYAGEVQGRDAVLARAREWLAERPSAAAAPGADR
ncbi:MAG TPA: HDIG domain-containing protein [Solirubrobacteraceae bacterium]|nr:HDIG domain-containing protein [Solirubrobacteraceae bacterium]